MDTFQKISLETEVATTTQEFLVKTRRHFHQNAENSWKEFETCKFIETTLREVGFEELYVGIAGTGVVAVLRGELDESILLRADIDAVAIDECTGLSFSSKNKGAMHACGHDGHTACLLGTAIILHRKVKEGLKLKHGIKFCFQPAEEGGETCNGALTMIEDKSIYDVMDASPKVKNCFGLHITSAAPLGFIAYDTKEMSCNSDRFSITVNGKGGHAMSPEETVDALHVGVQIVNAVYQIRGRNIDQKNPCTISIGKFTSGTNFNIITDHALVWGSLRTVNRTDREIILQKLQNICTGAELMHDCKVTFNLISGYKSVYNDPSLQPLVLNAIKETGLAHLRRTMGLAGEDFYNFAGNNIQLNYYYPKDRCPSGYVAIGAAIKQVGGTPIIRAHHSSTFDFDEAVLIDVVRFWIGVINQYQK